MSAIHLAVAVFLNSLWEDALLVLAVWALLKNIRVNASTRYFSWLVTLVAAVLLPIFTTLPQVAVSYTARAQPVPASSERVALAPALEKSRAVAHVRPSPQVAAPSNGLLSGLRFPSRLQFVMPTWLAKALFWAWAALALLIAGRLALDLYRLERLKREALPLPFELRDQMARWVEVAYGPSRQVRICVSDRIEVPVAVGLFDSMILLPSRLLEQLSAHEIDRISLHELAHLRRADDWTNSLQRLAQILFFFNPAIRFIGAQLDLEREVACDDWVLALTGEIRPYATCLTKMAELTAWPHRPLAAPGVFATRKGISVRIERLLNQHRNARVNVAYLVPAGVVAALATLFVLANVVTPVIAYTPEGAVVTQPSLTVHKLPAPRHVSVIRPLVTAQALPASLPSPVRTVVHTVVHTKTVYVHQTIIRHVPTVTMHGHPAYHAAVSVPAIDVNVPAVHVSVPATTVSVSAVHVHVPAMHIGVPTVGRQVIARNGASCDGCDLANVNWAGQNLSNRSFSGANFSHANLAGTNFSRSSLSGVNFEGADLRDANFIGALLSGCNLEGANISGARFDHANIAGCQGVNPRELDRTQLRLWVAQCSGCDFSGADFRGMSLRGLHISGVDFSRADFRDADLSGAEFSGVDFSRALLAGARVRGSRFTGCDFSRTDLRNVDLGDASITASDLSSAIMR